MKEPLDDKFIAEINHNMGIVHKVCGIYYKGLDEGEDVKQEMLYQLWKAYPGFQGKAKFSTWMYRVCLNTALTYLKKRKSNHHETITQKHLQIAGEPEDRNESIQKLHRAIEYLSPVNKAITLLYLEDLRYEDIAEITGLTRSNVSVRLVRIKKELEKELRKKY